MGGFDRLPDCLIIVVFNSVSDVKTVTRCRAVSKRFNSLVPQTDSLFLKIDRVVSLDSDSFPLNFFKTVFKFLHGFIPQQILPFGATSQKSPVEILRGFKRIRQLKMELPSGDIRIDQGTVVKWKAEFGKSLKKSVILGFNAIRKSPPMEMSNDVAFGKRMKTRVEWTINALIESSARHKLLKEVVAEHGELERIVMEDKEEEGRVIMDKKGIKEWIDCSNQKMKEDEEDKEKETRRTRIQTRVKMKMREEPGWVELRSGAWVQGGTLVVIRPSSSTVEGTHMGKDDVDEEDDEVALGAFNGVYRELVEALMKKGQRQIQSYVLEFGNERFLNSQEQLG